jgi:hypothetical protein
MLSEIAFLCRLGTTSVVPLLKVPNSRPLTKRPFLSITPSPAASHWITFDRRGYLTAAPGKRASLTPPRFRAGHLVRARPGPLCQLGPAQGGRGRLIKVDVAEIFPPCRGAPATSPKLLTKPTTIGRQSDQMGPALCSNYVLPLSLNSVAKNLSKQMF